MKSLVCQIRACAGALLALGFFAGVLYPAVVALVSFAFPRVPAPGVVVLVDEGEFAPRFAPVSVVGGDEATRRREAMREAGRRARLFRVANGLPAGFALPSDAVFPPSAPWDPAISPANARAQAGRVARARGLSLEIVRLEIDRYTRGRWLGVFGEPAVEVAPLNAALGAGETRSN